MTKLLLFMFIAAVLITSIGNRPATYKERFQHSLEMIATGEKMLHEGDLVLRNYYEFTSGLIKNFSRRDKCYSHAGIVIFENSYPFIYHITKSENGSLRDIRKDSLKVFCSPANNNGYGIFRFNLSPRELVSIKSILRQFITDNTSFDMRFDYQSDDKMYCSEMIAKLLNRGTKGRIRIDQTKPSEAERLLFNSMHKLPMSYGKGRSVVAIDNLYLNPNCKAVARFNYGFR